MKKMLSLVLTLAMVLSLTATAWGAYQADCPGSCAHEAAIGTTHYDTLEEAVTAATADSAAQTIVMLKNVAIESFILLDGDTLDGGEFTLDATALGGLADSPQDDDKSAIKTKGCTIKDLTIKGGWKGVLILETADKATLLDNVTIVESARGICFTKNGSTWSNADLTVKNSTIAGWNSFATNGDVVFENTTFAANASGRGNGLNPRNDMTLTDCTVDAGVKLSNEDLDAGEAFFIDGGTYNGEFDVTLGDGTFVITAGTFSGDVTEYLAPGLEQDSTGVVIGAGGTQVNPSTATKPVKGNGLANDTLYTYSKANGLQAVATDSVTFGTTVYALLTAEDRTPVKADAVKGLSVSDKWEKNGNYVADVEIVKVGGHYAIAISTTGSSLEEVELLGEIAVKGKSLYTDAQGKAQKADVKFDFDVEIDLAYGDGTEADKITLVDGEKKVYDFKNYDPATSDDTIEVVFGELSAVVSPKGMNKVLLAYNDDEVEELYDAYVDADLTFINCTAAFRRTAEVTVDLLDTEYFYEIVDGKLVAVDGEYDEWTEEFTFKTRRLGSYVISDVELVVEEEVVVTNPSTGAAA